MAFKKPLPTVQQLIRGDKAGAERLLRAIKDLQDDATPISGLVNAGIARLTANGVIYAPPTTTTPTTPFDDTDNTKPDLPTNLAATVLPPLLFLYWDVPLFQPFISYADVWIIYAPLFSELDDYAIGDFVTYAGTVYLFTMTHAAGVWDAGDVAVAGGGDLIVSNANQKIKTNLSSAVLPIDVTGGYAYCWVRLVSLNGVAGEFAPLVVMGGSVSYDNVRYISITTATYTVSQSELLVNGITIFGVNYAGSVTITIPAPIEGQIICFNDESGNAATNNITITTI